MGLAWPSGAPQTNAHGPWSTGERAFVRRLWGGAAIYSKENIHIYPYARVRYSATRAYAFGASNYTRRLCGALSTCTELEASGMHAAPPFFPRKIRKHQGFLKKYKSRDESRDLYFSGSRSVWKSAAKAERAV